MQIEPLTRIDQIKPGDALLISDGERVISTTAKLVLDVGGSVGTEVVFNRKRNKYFNVGMYLSGRSWAKDVRVVTMPSNGSGKPTTEAAKPL